MKASFSSVLLGFVAFVSTLAAPESHKVTIPLPQRVVHEFPPGTWVENIHVRPNGNLLVTTSTPNASIYEVVEPWTETPEVLLVYTFDEWANRLIGIGESTEDTYVVVGSRFDTTASTGVPIRGTWVTLELSYANHLTRPTTRLITAMPEAVLLQSIDCLPNDRSVVLISDEFAESSGRIWRLDTRTGEYWVVAQNLTQLDTDGSVSDVGINGLKIRGDQLYWCNSNLGSFFRMKIDADGVPVPGAKPDEIVHYDGGVFDDFTFGPYGEDLIWAAGNADSRIFAIGLNGKVEVILGAGTDSFIPSPTATSFGKRYDKTILYVTTGLYTTLTANGTYTFGGSVRAIDTTGFSL